MIGNGARPALGRCWRWRQRAGRPRHREQRAERQIGTDTDAVRLVTGARPVTSPDGKVIEVDKSNA